MRRNQPDRRHSAAGRRAGTPPLRVGVIGVGNMGAHHARVYASLAGLCELHGVYDVDRSRTAAIAMRQETRAYERIEDLLQAVDAVSVASPSSFHVEHALLAIEAGVDVLIEKPVALTVAEAGTLLEAASHAPERIVAVGHVEHFNPAIRELRKLLAGQPVIAVDIHRLSPFDGRITDADVVQDLMLHDLHVVLSIARSPLRYVQSVARSVRSRGHDDYAVAHLVFDDGMIASVSASRVTEEKIRRLTATTTEAHVTADYLNRTIEACRWTRLQVDDGDGRSYRQESVVERIFVPQEEPLVAELRSFLQCVRERCEPEVGLEMGVRCLEVVDQVRAARRGDVPEVIAA
jgi:predicted dehydrogenase